MASPAGAASPFWLPATTASRPQASIGQGIPATAEIPSTRKSEPAFRTAGAIFERSFASPTLVSLCTTQTARTFPFSSSWTAASTGMCWPQGAESVVTWSQ